MKRREFLKVIGGAAGLSIFDLERGLSAVTKVFDEETKQWYLSQTLEFPKETKLPKYFNFSYWIKIEGGSWEEKTQQVVPEGRKVTVLIQVPKSDREKYNLAQTQLSSPENFSELKTFTEEKEQASCNKYFRTWHRESDN